MKRNSAIQLLLAAVLILVMSCGTNTNITGPDVPDSIGMAFGTDSTFDVITWNIENYPKHDPETTDLLKILLPALKVECVAIQEVNSSYALYTLVSDVPGWSYKISGAGDTQTAVLYNTQTVQVDSFATIFSGLSNPFPRPPLLVKLHWQDQEIILISMHLKAYGDDVINNANPNDEEVRRQYACQLLDQYIEAYFPDAKVIVVGDMNDQIQEPATTNVFMSFINKPQEYSFADMSIAQHLTSQNCSYPNYSSHLDHILITNELFDAYAASSSYVKTLQIEHYITPGGWSSYENLISDHRPVGARFKFLAK
jgi:hypothetical protein